MHILVYYDHTLTMVLKSEEHFTWWITIIGAKEEFSQFHIFEKRFAWQATIVSDDMQWFPRAIRQPLMSRYDVKVQNLKECRLLFLRKNSQFGSNHSNASANLNDKSEKLKGTEVYIHIAVKKILVQLFELIGGQSYLILARRVQSIRQCMLVDKKKLTMPQQY